MEEKKDKIEKNKRNSHIILNIQKMLEEENIFISINEIRTKMHTLKGRFRKEKKIIGPSGGSPSSWEHFDNMKDILGKSKFINSIELMEESFTVCDPNSVQNWLDDIFHDDFIIEQQQPPSPFEPSTSSTIAPPSTSSTIAPPSPFEPSPSKSSTIAPPSPFEKSASLTIVSPAPIKPTVTSPQFPIAKQRKKLQKNTFSDMIKEISEGNQTIQNYIEESAEIGRQLIEINKKMLSLEERKIIAIEKIADKL